MKTIITPQTVISLAFGGEEFISPQRVTTADIAAATHRFLVPIMGSALVEKVADGGYPTLLDQFVAPALAFAVRTLLQPSLNVRTGDAGVMIPQGDNTHAAWQSTLKTLQLSLKNRTSTLLRMLSDHLSQNSSLYPEYDQKHDILKHCSINGGFVQTF